MWYVIIVYLHYLHTGDAKFAEEFEPVVDRAMAWLLRRINDDGLIEVLAFLFLLLSSLFLPLLIQNGMKLYRGKEVKVKV